MRTAPSFKTVKYWVENLNQTIRAIETTIAVIDQTTPEMVRKEHEIADMVGISKCCTSYISTWQAVHKIEAVITNTGTKTRGCLEHFSSIHNRECYIDRDFSKEQSKQCNSSYITMTQLYELLLLNLFTRFIPSDHFLSPNLRKWFSGKNSITVKVGVDYYFENFDDSHYKQGIKVIEQNWIELSN